MRKIATRLAIQEKFKDLVEEYHKELVTVVTKYVENIPSNKAAITTYNNCTDDFKRLVRLESSISMYKRDASNNGNVNFFTHITNTFDFLGIDGAKEYSPFTKKADNRNMYYQSVKLVFSLSLIETSFNFTDSVPVEIQDMFDKRKQLMNQIDVFANDVYHAFCQVKNIKEVRQHIPALEQYIDIPEKKFTRLVPYSFFDAVNKSVNN